MNKVLPTIADSLKYGQSMLDGFSESARLDTEVFLAEVLGRDRAFLYTYDDYRLTQSDRDIFEHYINRRTKGEPVAYILGKREFWSLMLSVGPEALIPRPDTETLVALVLELCEQSCARLLDLGTGTGAIALALASEKPRWKIDAVDCIDQSVLLADYNRKTLGFENVTVYCSDWFAQLAGKTFDVIASNPPYIDAEDCHLAQGDVMFEPKTALVSGNGGLADIFHIADTAALYLNPEGWLVIEHGYDQGEKVRQRFLANGYRNIHTVNDLGGNERVTAGMRPCVSGGVLTPENNCK